MVNEPAGEALAVESSEQDGVTVLAVTGELDLVGAPKLADRAYSVAAQAVHGLVIDLTGVHFLSSSGVSVLVRTVDSLPSGAMGVLVAPHAVVQRPILLSGLDRVITTVADRPAAFAAIAATRT
ncbi:anti-sigma factor antagonist [Rhodococcus sp. 15-649-1-2]|uniref:STAS domain-containing protein n=1 Tax=Nocardiaceae TaxID=85025 RepID=UPI000522E2E5|nr:MULTISPECIES: STAS domain-containing protein [Rhodococcus]OZC55619.1 anti-sigma factor antagonist [Rhodococcus sp. 06-621-2]OZD08748.1 anti-sigma factor antagonist [Rhodococcus sp. 06-156-4C]OZD17326.1 anti-sigma factor antagonist [Rhodococcus sp. 06-156-3C]OZD18663.1 anti-sigma factor antagonist [Rhodococcus sp. 06-156-4a]OZD25070.1 anti-sigma factor antagonist [Rhodococcus sp. 06-156-3b]